MKSGESSSGCQQPGPDEDSAPSCSLSPDSHNSTNWDKNLSYIKAWEAPKVKGVEGWS